MEEMRALLGLFRWFTVYFRKGTPEPDKRSKNPIEKLEN